MSPPKSEPPLVIEQRPSGRLVVYAALGHAALLGMVFVAAPPPWVATAAFAAVVSLLQIWWRHLWQGSGAYVRRAHWEADGSWSIECGDGSVATARLTPSGCCHNALILLNFELTRRGSRSLVLLNDSLPAETGRRLRTRLRRLKRL